MGTTLGPKFLTSSLRAVTQPETSLGCFALREAITSVYSRGKSALNALLTSSKGGETHNDTLCRASSLGVLLGKFDGLTLGASSGASEALVDHSRHDDIARLGGWLASKLDKGADGSHSFLLGDGIGIQGSFLEKVRIAEVRGEAWILFRSRGAKLLNESLVGRETSLPDLQSRGAISTRLLTFDQR